MQKIFEKVCLYSFLLMTIGSFTVLFMGADLHERTLDEGNLGTNIGLRATIALVYAGSAFLILLRYKSVLLALRQVWFTGLLVVWASLSTAWSVDPQTTIRRSAILLSTAVFGVYLGSRYKTAELQRIVFHFFVVVIVASLVLLAVKPSYAVDTFHANAFRGITEHKNLFGEYMGIFLVLCVTYSFHSKAGLKRCFSVLVAAAAVVVSHASTALLAAAGALAFLPILLIFRFTPRQIPAILLGTTVSYALVIEILIKHADFLLSGLGKDSTLTGRAEIWAYVLQSISRRPLAGYGYDAFWQGLHGESLTLTSLVGWQVPHSHNGYLEVLLGLGSIGLGFLLLSALKMAKDSVYYLRAERGPTGLWPAGLLAYFLLHALAEASLLVRDGLSFLLFVAFSTSVALERRRVSRVDFSTEPTLQFRLSIPSEA